MIGDKQYQKKSYELTAAFEDSIPYTIGIREDKTLNALHQQVDVHAIAELLSLSRTREDSLVRFTHLDAVLKTGGVFASGTIRRATVVPDAVDSSAQYIYEKKGIVQSVTVAEPDNTYRGIIEVPLTTVSLAITDAAYVHATAPAHSELAVGRRVWR